VELWESLHVGVEEITEVPEDRAFLGFLLTARGRESGVETEPWCSYDWTATAGPSSRSQPVASPLRPSGVTVGGEEDADRFVRVAPQLSLRELHVHAEHGEIERDREDEPVEVLRGEVGVVDPE
jgi:hypothetical protein